MALSLELNHPASNEPVDLFNEVQVRALLAGLSAVYEEVFIWTTGKNIGVWVTGSSEELMVRAFHHFLLHLENGCVVQGEEAIALFDAIVTGDEWSKINGVEKLDQLANAERLANEMDSLHETLGPLVRAGLDSLERQPLISGMMNGWVSGDRTSVSKKVCVKGFPSVFFRYSLN